MFNFKRKEKSETTSETTTETTTKQMDFSWLKHNHEDSLKYIQENLNKNWEKQDEMEIFEELNKKGVIAEVCIDNFVSINMFYYPDKFFLILDLVQQAMKQDKNTNFHRNVYNPKPSSLTFDEAQSGLDYAMNVLQKIKKTKSLNDIDDLKLIEDIGFNAYKVVKHALYQTQDVDIKISSLASNVEYVGYIASEYNKHLHQQIKQRKKASQQLPQEIKTNDQIQETLGEVKIYEVNYPLDTKEWDNHFMFHGSQYHNWYSILNNGLYVPKNHQIVNGSALGVGIYLANTATTSLGYSSYAKGKFIMGIVQVNNAKKYSKNHEVSVVTDSNDARVKYLIVCNDLDKIQNYYNYIGQYLTRRIELAKQKNKDVKKDEIHNRITLKRLQKELQQIKKVDKIYDFPIDVDLWESKLNIWRVHIHTPETKWGTMVWEIRFSNDFPAKPPFVRLISPQFKYLTGHVTMGGAFCNPILTNQKWRPAISMPTLIETLLVNMEEGGAEVDKKKTQAYSLEAAQAAYIRYTRAHGWN